MASKVSTFSFYPYLSSARTKTDPKIYQTSQLVGFVFQNLKFLIKTTAVEPKIDRLTNKTDQQTNQTTIG
jgi:hypothetical protein